jgi:Tol biopolymer transport system component
MRKLMKTDQKSILRNIVMVLIIISLTTIFGCKWGSWSFDLFGGDPINGDDGDSSENGDFPAGNGIELFVVPVDGISVDFPPAVFSANIGGTKINEPVELFASFDNGSDITALTGVVNRGGLGDEFKVSPDGTRVAYLTAEKSEDGTETRISQLPSTNADVVEFDWSPDGTRIAYLADGEIDGRFELYTNLAEGGDNVKVSDSLPPGGMVDAFEWSPDSNLIAYTADQNNLGEFELFTTPPTESNPVRVSGNVLPNNGDVTEFSWAPDSSRIAYLSNQRLAGLFELFTSLPRDSDNSDLISEGASVQDFAWAPDLDQVNESLAFSTERTIFTAPPNGGSSTQVTPGLTVGGSISDFSWGPDSSRIAYRADQRFDDVIELFAVNPDGSDNLRISGVLTNGGDVTDFVWSPDSDFIAYRANQDSAVIFELYVTTPDGRLSDTKVSGVPMAGDVEASFEWSPDSTRVAYLADERFVGVIELFTSTPDGQTNDRVSGDLSNGGNVEEFKWAPLDISGISSGIGYIADQANDEVFELFASTPDGDETTRLSGSFAEAGDVLFFEWVP